MAHPGPRPTQRLTEVPVNLMGVQSSRKGGVPFLPDRTPALLNRGTNRLLTTLTPARQWHTLQLITVIRRHVLILN